MDEDKNTNDNLHDQSENLADLNEETLVPEVEEDFIPEGNQRVDELENRISDLEEELENEKNLKLRALADYQNQRTRFEREKKELLSFSQTALLAKVLEIFNDFDNSLRLYSEENKDSWKEGIEMLYQKFLSVLESEGVEIIKVNEGDMFNPSFHEAISFIPVAEVENDQKVAHVVSLGFKQSVSGQVIRTAKVIVNKKQ